MKDEDGFFTQLSETTIAIVGLGLIGGSLAMALRGSCKKLLGCDIDPATIQLAREKQIVDFIDSQIENVLPEADFIILATPVRTILQILNQISSIHPENAIILDTGSTKVKILEAMNQLPERFDPLGGHPICGKEKGSLEVAEATLFVKTPFVLTPLQRTSSRARQLSEQLIRIIGAQTLWMDAKTHDRLAASTSHMPYLISSALTAATPDEVRGLIGPGFRSMARIAATPPSMMLDVLLTNKENILNALEGFRDQLDYIEQLLETEHIHELQQFLLNSAKHQNHILQPIKQE